MLAINGYGSMASACKKYLGIEYVITMLNELVNKVLETFINVPEDVQRELDVNYPKHVQAIANILAEMSEEHVGVDVVMDLQVILVHLIKKYPTLPPQFQGFATEAFLDISKYYNMNNVIFVGILETCSHPIVTEAELLNDGMICTKKYLPFWKKVTANENILNEVLQCLLVMVDKLNFAIDTFQGNFCIFLIE